MIDELTENGVIGPRRYYVSPFTDLNPHGPDALFESPTWTACSRRVAEVRRRAEVT